MREEDLNKVRSLKDLNGLIDELVVDIEKDHARLELIYRVHIKGCYQQGHTPCFTISDLGEEILIDSIVEAALHCLLLYYKRSQEVYPTAFVLR